MRSSNKNKSRGLDAVIQIEGHFKSKVYTSGDNITGNVVFKAQRDTYFDDLDIVLSGTASATLKFVRSYPVHSRRRFLEIKSIINSLDLPEDRIFAANKPYTVPFSFTIPYELSKGSCSHICASTAVHEQHMRLPPSVGSWEGNDRAPKTTAIEYSVAVRVHGASSAGRETPRAATFERREVLNVLSHIPEEPPMNISKHDERYQMAFSGKLRRKVVALPVGRITATADQPDAAMLSINEKQTAGSFVRVNLQFAPKCAKVSPPKITSTSGKIVASTFYGDQPAEDFPDLGESKKFRLEHRLKYEKPSPITIGNTSRVLDWRPSYAGDGEKQGPERLEATLDIPFTIPSTRGHPLIPTFHSCLISRTYVLHLKLSLGYTNATVSLSVPVQVATAGENPSGQYFLPSFESAMADKGLATESCRPQAALA